MSNGTQEPGDLDRVAGGVIAAVLGPALAAWSKDLFPAALFAAPIDVAILGLASALLLLAFYRDAEPAPAAALAKDELAPRPLAEILRQPIFIASVANNVVGSVAMMFVMTAAPACGRRLPAHDRRRGDIIQWHLVGMFAPSFFAGALIKRFGLTRILLAGMVLNALCVVAAIA